MFPNTQRLTPSQPGTPHPPQRKLPLQGHTPHRLLQVTPTNTLEHEDSHYILFPRQSQKPPKLCQTQSYCLNAEKHSYTLSRPERFTGTETLRGILPTAVSIPPQEGCTHTPSLATPPSSFPRQALLLKGGMKKGSGLTSDIPARTSGLAPLASIPALPSRSGQGPTPLP